METSSGTVAFIPVKAETCGKGKEISQASVKGFKLSIYHEIQGVFGTTPYGRFSDKKENLNEPGSKDGRTHRNFDAPLFIKNYFKYGTTPRSAFFYYKKALFDKQSIELELKKLQLDTSDIRATEIKYVEKSEFFPLDDGHLRLCLSYFDDVFQFQTKMPKDWIHVSVTNKTATSATTLLPVKAHTLGSSQEVTWEWQDVRVLDYCEKKQMYRVAKCECEPSLQPDDLLIPRIYIKFAAETSEKFAKRLKCAVMNRYLVQESFRRALNIEFMPMDNLPSWNQLDMESIIGNARRGLTTKTLIMGTNKFIKEINLDYKRACNYMSYWTVSNEKPSLMGNFRSGFMSHKSHNQLTKVEVTPSFQTNLKNFSDNTFWSKPEVWKALYDVQKFVLCFSKLTMYQLPDEATVLEEFENTQISKIETVECYVRKRWIYEIANAILKNLSCMEKGKYDIHQKLQHTFVYTKLNRLLRRVTLIIEATVCDWVKNSLRSFAESITTRCRPLILVTKRFEWRKSLSSDCFSPSCNPLFLVPLVLVDGSLQFGTALSKYRKFIIDLFERGLHITGGLSELLKLVMKDTHFITYYVSSVRDDDPEIVAYRGRILGGMSKALFAAQAYVSAYKENLKVLNDAPSSYGRLHKRLNTSDEDIIKTINMHMQEEKRLQKEIPDYQDIGPFRLMTIQIRNVLVKRHKLLASALTQSYYYEFLTLLAKVELNFEAITERIVTKSSTFEDLDRKHIYLNRGYNKDLEIIQKEIDKLNKDYALLLSIDYNIEDDDFIRLSNAKLIPKAIISMVEQALIEFVEEREFQRKFYQKEKNALIVKLFLLSAQISATDCFTGFETISERLQYIHKIRMGLEKYKLDLCVQQRRERLLGITTADQSAHLRKIADTLWHHENWLESAKEFQKLQELIMANPRAVDKTYVEAKIKTVKSKLAQSVEHFKGTTTLQDVTKVQNEVDYFVKTKLSKLV